MRVVFLKDVEGVALGGDVKEVKDGFARNYLIPKQLAMVAGHNALKRVVRLQQQAEDERIKHLTEMKALAEGLNGRRVDIGMRAGATGRLYGSVNNAIVAAELSNITEREIERRVVQIQGPIREVGVYDVGLRLHAEVDIAIQVVVYPSGADPEETVAAAEAGDIAESTAEPAEDAEAEDEALAESTVEPAEDAEAGDIAESTAGPEDSEDTADDPADASESDTASEDVADR